jgi:hypothetical protein
MSILHISHSPASDTHAVVSTPAAEHGRAEKASTTVLITQQEVLFGTAVAAAIPQSRKHWWTGATQALHTTLHPPTRHHPRLGMSYLRDSMEDREKYRL